MTMTVSEFVHRSCSHFTFSGTNHFIDILHKLLLLNDYMSHLCVCILNFEAKMMMHSRKKIMKLPGIYRDCIRGGGMVHRELQVYSCSLPASAVISGLTRIHKQTC